MPEIDLPLRARGVQDTQKASSPMGKLILAADVPTAGQQHATNFIHLVIDLVDRAGTIMISKIDRGVHIVHCRFLRDHGLLIGHLLATANQNRFEVYCQHSNHVITWIAHPLRDAGMP